MRVTDGSLLKKGWRFASNDHNIIDALTGCPELEVLHVYENGISDATLSHMTSVVRAGMCECLRELVAVRNRQEISEAAAAAFIEAHPHIKLK